MKDSEDFEECCDNCKAYQCTSLVNLDKMYGSDVYDWAKKITRKVGCIVKKDIVDKEL